MGCLHPIDQIGTTLHIDALSDTLVSVSIWHVMGAALCVVAWETDVIVSPIPCYPKREGSAAQLFYQQAGDLSSNGTLMGHLLPTPVNKRQQSPSKE